MNLLTKSVAVHILKLIDGTEILFSYGVPVAGFLMHQGHFKTDMDYGPAAQKHIREYIKNADAMTLNQRTIDCLLIK